MEFAVSKRKIKDKFNQVILENSYYILKLLYNFDSKFRGE